MNVGEVGVEKDCGEGLLGVGEGEVGGETYGFEAGIDWNPVRMAEESEREREFIADVRSAGTKVGEAVEVVVLAAVPEDRGPEWAQVR